jgi:hypothetical protein
MHPCDVHLLRFKSGKRIIESKDIDCDPDRFCYSWSTKYIVDQMEDYLRQIETWAELLTQHDVDVPAIFPYGLLRPDMNQVLALPQDWTRGAVSSIEGRACSIHRTRMELHSRRLPN